MTWVPVQKYGNTFSGNPPVKVHRLLFLKGSMNLNSPRSKSSCTLIIHGLSSSSISMAGLLYFSIQKSLSPTSTSQQCRPELNPCEARTPTYSLSGFLEFKMGVFLKGKLEARACCHVTFYTSHLKIFT